MIVTVLCVAGVLAPAAAGAAANPESALDRVNDELEDAESNLRGVERRKAVALSDLERIDARQAELDAQLERLGVRLDAAEAALADSQARLAQTTQTLTAVEGQLADTRARLEDNQDEFSQRARSTYMYGGQASWTHLVLGIDSIDEFQRGLKYARSVLRNDQEVVERISALESTVQRTTVELGKLQDERAAQRAVDARRRDEAAAIVAEREAVAREVEVEADKRRLLVARLETDRESYMTMVANLEATGEQLEAELREREVAAAAREAAAAERAAIARAAAARGATTGATAGPAPASAGAMQWPVIAPVTSPFGWRTHPVFGTRRFHAGMDIGAPDRTPIGAATDGVVVSAGWRGGYGNAVVIDHGGGVTTTYAHQSSVAVSAGQRVSRGQTIGYVGSTGYSTGPHVHFEVRVNGSPTNPMAYL